MSGNDARIVAVLRDLAWLGRRIGERAAELALLTEERGGEARRTPAGNAADIVGAATRLASRAESVAGTRRGDRAGSAPVMRASVRGRPRPGIRQKPKPRLFGAVAASSLVHVIALVALALFAVSIDARPTRVALTLGEASGPDVALDEAAPLDMSVGEAPEVMADEVPLESSTAEHVLEEDLHALLEAQATGPASMDDDLPTDWLAGAVAASVPGGGGEGSGASGARRGSADVPRGAATFFGRQGNARSVCFLCDNSNSYRDGGFHRVLDEIARAVDALSPQQSFFVIFFSDAAYPLFHPVAAEALQAATPENKRRVREWLGTVEMCRGGQGIDDALRLAGTLGADVIYLLSDGELGGSVVERLAAADVGDTVVHTFGLQQHQLDRRTGLPDPGKVGDQQRRNGSLIAIATAHGGTFTPVAAPPQAALLEKTRPIRRNRSRGPVWGLRL